MRKSAKCVKTQFLFSRSQFTSPSKTPLGTRYSRMIMSTIILDSIDAIENIRLREEKFPWMKRPCEAKWLSDPAVSKISRHDGCFNFAQRWAIA